MRIAFELTRKERITPSEGEDTGRTLAEAGALLLKSYEERGAVPTWYRPFVAQIYSLAADAYESGAAASIGHNRADRYQERANELRGMAEKLCQGAQDGRTA